MTKRSLLDEIVTGMESQGPEMSVYFDRQKREIITFMDDELRAAEEGEDEGEDADLPDWQRETNAAARQVLDDDGVRFVALPDSFNINEWDIMRRYAQAQADPNHSAPLLDAIHGRGAFRCFKDRVHGLGLADSWYAYRDEQYRRIAAEWCREKGIDLDASESGAAC